jgi:hypothetical protein
MSTPKKEEVITFKVDARLAEVLRTIPNRSEFIRTAILNAVENVCPLCLGAGTLTLQQRRHWDEFVHNHTVKECDDCHAVHLVCNA